MSMMCAFEVTGVERHATHNCVLYGVDLVDYEQLNRPLP